MKKIRIPLCHTLARIFFLSLLESDSYIRYMWSKYKVSNSYKETLRLLEEYELDAFIGLTRGPAWRINYDGVLICFFIILDFNAGNSQI